MRNALQEVVLKKLAEKNICMDAEDLIETVLSAMAACMQQILMQPSTIEKRKQCLTRKDLYFFLIKTMSWIKAAADLAEVKLTNSQIHMASEWLIQVALSTLGSSLQTSCLESTAHVLVDNAECSFLERLILRKAHTEKKVLTSLQVEQLFHKMCTQAKKGIQTAFTSQKKNRIDLEGFRPEKHIERAIDGYQRLLQNHRMIPNQSPEVVRQEATRLALASWDRIAVLVKEM